MQWGLSKDAFNSNYILQQLTLVTWFHLSQGPMLRFESPLFKRVAGHMNCGNCFPLQRSAEYHHPPQKRLTAAPQHGALTASLLAKGNSCVPISGDNRKPWIIALHAACIPGAAHHTGFFFASEWPNIRPAGKNFHRLQLVGFLCKLNSTLLPNFWLIKNNQNEDPWEAEV